MDGISGCGGKLLVAPGESGLAAGYTMPMTPLERQDFADILLHPPDAPDRKWAGDVLLQIVEGGVIIGYRPDPYRIQGGREVALATLAQLLAALHGLELEVLLRTLLVVEWEGWRRATGLTVKPADAIEILAMTAPVGTTRAAFEEVIDHGAACLKRYAREDLLAEWRKTGGQEFTLDAATARQLGVKPGRFRIDRVAVALSAVHVARWQANLRPMVPALLALLEEHELAPRVEGLVARAMTEAGDVTGQYLTLGLVDWATRHLDHALAPDVLATAVKGRTGPVRQAAAMLAAAMGRLDVVEHLAGADPDAGVRRRASALRDGW